MRPQWASLRLAVLLLVLAISQSLSQKSEPLEKSWDTLLKQETNALLRIRSSLESFDRNGPIASWKIDETAGEAQVCQWRGVECEWNNDGHGRVVALQLSSSGRGAGISGTLPEAFAALRKLRTLEIEGNNFRGMLPESWSVLSELEVLDLSGNKVSGTLPPSWNELRSLRRLDLSSNSIKGFLPPRWLALESLVYLDMSKNHLTGPLPKAWAKGLKSLSFLSLEKNELTRTLPPLFNEFQKLRTLNLASNSLSGSIPGHWVLGVFSTVLTNLYLSNNKLTGVLPGIWAPKLSSLQKLDLRNNMIQGSLPETWGLFPSLVEVKMSKNNISGVLPETWALLRGLKTIDLADNVISGSMPPSWGFLTSVQVINLSSNNLKGNLPGGWTGMEALVTLAAADCQLSGRLGSARSWTALRNLQVLRLGGNTLSGSLPKLWSDFESLQILDVKSNKVSGTLPESWAEGPLGRTLEVLDAGDNEIEGVLAAEWGHLNAIEKLRLQQNELKGQVPGSWSLLTRLQQLDLSSNPKVKIDSIPVALGKQLECPGCTAMERLLEEQQSDAVPKMWSGPNLIKEREEESGAEEEEKEEDVEEGGEEGKSSEAYDADFYMDDYEADGADYIMDDYSLDYEFPAPVPLYELFPVDSRGVAKEEDEGGLVIDQAMLIALCTMCGVLVLVIIATSWVLCKGRKSSKNIQEAVPQGGGGVANLAPRAPSAAPLSPNRQQRSKGSFTRQGKLPSSSAARPPPQSGIIDVVTAGGAVGAFPPRHPKRYSRHQSAMLRALNSGPLTRHTSPFGLSTKREREAALMRQSSNQPGPSSLRDWVATDEGHTKQICHDEAGGPSSSSGPSLFAAASQGSLDMESPRVRWAGNDIEYNPSEVTDETFSLKAGDSSGCSSATVSSSGDNPQSSSSHIRSQSMGEPGALEGSSNYL